VSPPGSREDRNRPSGPEDPSDTGSVPEASEGWEGLAEEPSAGTLEPSDELEEALREASEAVEAHHGSRGGRRGGPPGGAGPRAVDVATIEALSAELQSLKGEYESSQRELEESRDRLLRLAAEFDNFRKRTLRERQETQLYGHQNLVKELLATVDNLQRAIDHAGAGEGAAALQGLREGVELVLRDLLTMLQRHGVERIQALGETFDPALHEAMAQVPDASAAPNTVVQVLQEGYRLRDRMLRPARVVVSKGSGEGGQQGEGGSA
jgi:molecular chaperone GrpE